VWRNPEATMSEDENKQLSVLETLATTAEAARKEGDLVGYVQALNLLQVEAGSRKRKLMNANKLMASLP
jgi:hypothetical protein